jgi:hypothetical protein
MVAIGRHASAALLAGSMLVASVPVFASGDLGALMPDQVGDEAMYLMPDELEQILRASILDSSDIAALVSLYGLDPLAIPSATSANLDTQALLEAREAGTLTDEDAEDYATWSTDEAMFILAMQLGDIDMDDLLDSMVSLSGESDPADITIAGRRVVSMSQTDSDGGETWIALYPAGDVLFFVYSVDDDPSMLETLAALP